MRRLVKWFRMDPSLGGLWKVSNTTNIHNVIKKTEYKNVNVNDFDCKIVNDE